MQAIATRNRSIVYRTRGHGHGGITRLMSPSDLGESLKPFVFLDIFNMERPLLEAMRAGAGMSIHPHSGIATVTVLTEGRMKFDDPSSGTGMLSYGGVEWLRAGSGVWHGKELTPDDVPLVQGFQLWIALPPELENGQPESRYLEPQSIPSAGPARIILGEHAGEHGNKRRAERATGDHNIDQVEDAECGAVGAIFRQRAELRGDDDIAGQAQHAAQQIAAGDDDRIKERTGACAA